MADAAIQNPETQQIPDKLYFRIGEVSSLVGVEPYVLRYWETEFGDLSPKKSGTGHRLYRRKDVELLLRIKHLLYEKRFTIEGARQVLHSEVKPASRKKAPKAVPEQQQNLFANDLISEVRRELADILKLVR